MTHPGLPHKRRPRTSIPKILAVSLALGTLIPFLPLAFLTWRSYSNDVSRIEQEIEESNRQIARLAANSLDALVARVRLEASESAEKSPRLPEGLGTVLWERVGADGEVTASQLSSDRIGKSSGFQRFLAALAPGNAPSFSRVERWVPSLSPTVLVALRTGESFLVGVLDTDQLRAEMTAWSGVSVDRHLYAIDGTGRLLFYSDVAISRREVDVTANAPVRLHLQGDQGPVRFDSVVSGKPRLGFVLRLSSIDWAVIASADIGSQLIGLRYRYLELGWAIFFSLVAATAILLWTSRRLALPLLKIRDALRARSDLTGGPLQVASSIAEVGEYCELVEAFDDLSLRLTATERELVHAERTSLLGQLASGIAHEIGTPLNVMSGNAQYLLRKGQLTESARAALQQIVKQAERVTEMIRQLLDFARPTEPRQVPFQMGSVVHEALEMLSSVLGRIEVQVDLDDTAPLVLGDPRLIEHVLLNLIMNACQAMPAGGRLSVVVGVGSVADADPEEAWVCCRVIDTGTGIAAENLRRIFEPFYTTKAQGHGTGLGLAIVERIVRQHQGRVDVSSRPGAGSTFTLSLRPADALALSSRREDRLRVGEKLR
jgi:signal transduction histidine kinase